MKPILGKMPAAALVATLALLLVNGVVSFHNIRTLIDNDDRVAHTHQVLAQLADVVSTLKDAETGQRGYLLTGQDSYLKPYRTAGERLTGALQEVKNLTADNPAQQERVPFLEQKVRAKLDELKETIDLRRQGQADEALLIVRSGRGQQLMDEVRDLAGTMATAEEDLLRHRAEQSQRSARLTVLTFALATALSTILLGLVYYLVARDLRHQRRAATLAHEQGERFRTTLASIGDAVLVTDTQGHITFLNGVAESLTGWQHHEVLGRPLEDIFPIVNEFTRRPAENPVMKVLREGTVVGLANHTVLLSRQQGERPIDDCAAPVRNERGEVTGVVLVFRDVSERRRAEELRLRLAAIVESSTDAIIAKDMSGTIVSWNAGAERLYGYTAGEAVGKPVALLIPPDRPDELPVIMEQLAHGERIDHYETVRRRKDGTMVDVSVSISPLRNPAGTVIGAASIARDVGEWKRLERALQQQAEALLEQARLLDLAPVLIRNLDGRISLWNQGMERLYGWPKQEAVGRLSHTLLQTQFPRPREEIQADLLRDGSWEDELVHRRRDGTQVVVASLWVLHRDERGQPRAILEVNNDVTERRRAEAEVRRLNAELERRVHERTAQLEEVNEGLRAFSYSVSHDLRAPLRNIEGLAQALLEDYGDRLDAEGKDYAGRLVHSARRMDRLIQDILVYSRLSRADLELRRVELGAVVAEVQAELEEEFRAQQADVAVDGPLPAVWGHRATLAQVVRNLLTNAVKFVAAGQRPHVRIRAEERGPWVRLWVEDRGIGLAPEHRNRIFNVFERLHGDESYAGTGIGLAIVHKGAERMGGRVGVESELGSGSRFWVDLPPAETGA